MTESSKQSGVRRLFGVLGPGLVTGASDDDPAGILTYSQAGAQFRYGLLWTVWLQLPLMIAVQYTCAKIGLVSGRDLGRVLREHYPAWVMWFSTALLLVANTITAAADLAAVAAALELLTHLARAVLVVAAAAAMLGFSIGSYALLRSVLKWLSFALLAYVVSGVLAGPSWGDVLRRTFVPGFRTSHEYLTMFVSVFGTTISPYLFVWQSGEVVDDQKEEGRRTLASRRGATAAELRDTRLDTILGMTFSQLISYFIMISAGATLYPAGHRDIGSAREAAIALQPLGGGAGEVLFSLGVIATGLLALPTLLGASAFAVAAVVRRPAGMAEPPARAKTFYGVVAASTVLATAIALSGASPVRMLLLSALVNGILAPPLLVVLLLVARNRDVLGEHRNGRMTNALVIASAIIMGGASLWLAVWWVKGGQ